MKLIRLEVFREGYFGEGSRPAMSTLRRWVDNGDIPGKRIGSSYFVDEAGWLTQNTPANDDPLVAKVLGQ